MKTLFIKTFGVSGMLLASMSGQSLANCCSGGCPMNQGKPKITTPTPVKNNDQQTKLEKLAAIKAEARSQETSCNRDQVLVVTTDQTQDVSILAQDVGELATEVAQDAVSGPAPVLATNPSPLDYINYAYQTTLYHRGKTAVGAAVVATVAYGVASGKISMATASNVISYFIVTGQVTGSAVQTTIGWVYNQAMANQLTLAAAGIVGAVAYTMQGNQPQVVQDVVPVSQDPAQVTQDAALVSQDQQKIAQMKAAKKLAQEAKKKAQEAKKLAQEASAKTQESQIQA